MCVAGYCSVEHESANSCHELMTRPQKNMVSVFVFWRRRAHLSHVAAFWRFCVLALIVPPE